MTAAFRAVGLGWQPAERLPSHTAAEQDARGASQAGLDGGGTIVRATRSALRAWQTNGAEVPEACDY